MLNQAEIPFVERTGWNRFAGNLDQCVIARADRQGNRAQYAQADTGGGRTFLQRVAILYGIDVNRAVARTGEIGGADYVKLDDHVRIAAGLEILAAVDGIGIARSGRVTLAQ